MTNFKIVLSLVVLGTSVAATAQSPSTFQEAARTALRKNPLTGSNQKLIEAQELGVLSFNQSRLPSFVTSLTKIREHGRPGLDYTDAFAGLSWNIYRGGSDELRTDSMKAAVAAQKARIDSTDILLPDSNGQLASEVFTSFMTMAADDDGTKIVDDVEAIIAALLPYLDEDSKSQINTLSADLAQSRRKNDAERLEARETFIHFVLEAPASSIQTLNELLQSLKVPATPEEAIDIGLQKSPSIVALNYDLQSSQLKYEADRRQSTRPSVDVSVGRAYQRSASGGPAYTSNGNQIVLSLNYSWGPSIKTDNDSQLTKVKALELKLESERRKIRHRIASGYTSLRTAEEFMARYAERSNSEYQALEEILKQFRQGQKVKSEVILDKLKSFIDVRSYWTHYTMTSANRRFALQQAIGTLFENLDITPRELETIRIQHQR